MKLRNLSVLILMLMVFSLTSCTKKSDNRGVELTLKILPGTVTDSLYVKMNYQFSLADTFSGLTDDYKVFVHFWRLKNKESGQRGCLKS